MSLAFQASRRLPGRKESLVDAIQRQMQWPWQASGVGGTGSVLLGVVVLAGWWLAVVRIVQPIPGLPRIVPNTVSWFVLLGVSLLILRRRRIGSTRRWLERALALVVVLLAGTTVTEYLFARYLWMDLADGR